MGHRRLGLDWNKGNVQALIGKVVGQRPLEYENLKMMVDEMQKCMSEIPLKAAKKHIGLKAVGMAGRC